MKKLFVLYALSVALVFGFATSAAAAHYVVQKGDTLWLISKKLDVPFREILTLNKHLKNPSLIYPNDKIIISDRSNTPQVDTPSTTNAEAVLQLVNVERSKQGIPALKLSNKLNDIAVVKSKDMANKHYFSHNSPTYGSPFDMLKQFGVSYKHAGENIAAGQKTPQEVVDAWMKSPGHRANILNRNYSQIGIGYYKGGTYGTYWTQLFIGI